MLFARPVGVFLSLMFFRMKLRRRFYISWVGLRGAVPIVFATYPLLAGIDKANMIFNIVFFISVTSVLIKGTTLTIVAKWLNVSLPGNAKIISETDKLILEFPKSTLRKI
jgi:cell volume regulation protein A